MKIHKAIDILAVALISNKDEFYIQELLPKIEDDQLQLRISFIGPCWFNGYNRIEGFLVYEEDVTPFTVFVEDSLRRLDELEITS